MKANQLALVSALALAFAGVASAQTVPAEAWAGPVIATTGGMLSRAEVVTGMQQHMSQPQAAAEAWVGTAAASRIEVGAAKRTEVAADFHLYRRAGLSDYAARESFDPYAAESQRRIALYQRMRAGPEFAQEVARLEGGKLPTVASVKGSEARGN